MKLRYVIDRPIPEGSARLRVIRDGCDPDQGASIVADLGEFDTLMLAKRYCSDTFQERGVRLLWGTNGSRWISSVIESAS